MTKSTVLTIAMVLVVGCAWAGDGGAVRIMNRDGVDHSIEIDAGQKILHVFPGVVQRPGPVTVPAGGTATTELTPGPWSVYGDGNHRFTIMVTRGGDYDFTLQPFSQTSAYGGTSYGLLGLIDDGYNQSSYQLFGLAEVPQTVVVQPTPAPAPVVVVPSPSHYYPPPYHRDKGRDLGEAIGSAVFDILGEVLSDDHGHRRRHW